MERAVAIKKLGKLLGKKFGYHINNKAPTPEERDAAKAEMAAAVAERDALQKKRRERHEAVLAADAEYQSLVAAHNAASDRTDRLASIMHTRKITVGDTSNGMFFVVKAEGDSWEEVINKIETRKEVTR